MHISDGIVSAPVCIAAFAATFVLIHFTSRKTPAEEIPKMGMLGAALFVSSLIHFPIAGTSVHLGLFGIAGIILGKRVFPVVFAALLLQSLIFQHGGLLSLGLNTINMGAGAFAAFLFWKIKFIPEFIRAIIAGMLGIIIPASLMIFEFILSDYGSSISSLLIVYIITAAIEGGITLSAVLFLKKIKPEIIYKNLNNN